MNTLNIQNSKFKIQNSAADEQKRMAYFESLDGDEFTKFEHYVQRFAAAKNRRSEPFTWLEAERYAAKCVNLLRKYGILEGAEKIREVKI